MDAYRARKRLSVFSASTPHSSAYWKGPFAFFNPLCCHAIFSRKTAHSLLPLCCAPFCYGENQSADWFFQYATGILDLCGLKSALLCFHAEKEHHLTVMLFFWWGKVDSKSGNHVFRNIFRINL